jgi:hypothetical protein
MDELRKLDGEKKDSEENQATRTNSSASSNSDYELVDNETAEKEHNSKKQTTPVLENIVSEDLICDAMDNTAMIKSPSSNNVQVGKSIFYDCLGEKSEEKAAAAASDTDEGAE